MKTPKRLAENDDLTGALIASARADAPSPRARKRAAAAALGVATGAASVASGSSAAAGATATSVAKVAIASGWIKVGAGVVAALAIGGGIVVSQSSAPAPAPVRSAPTALSVVPAVVNVAPAEPRGVDTSTPALSADPTSVPSAVPEKPPVREECTGAHASEAAPSGAPSSLGSASAAVPALKSTAVAVAETESPLVRELKALDTARSALSRGEASAALASLDEHDRAFPAGPLRTEADILRVEALLAAGDANGARALARTLVARDPSGPHAQRLRSLAGDGK